ncbi:MAG: hypothetical protein U9R43_14975 [Thermodesulfobacteriota bacterium]|nr:hypothetical protein [Thermodesulfobacteriota bacterium]
MKENRILTILMGALLLGFAWQIRGSGTSDPSVVALLFLLFLSIHYGPRKKFNILVFGLIAFLFVLMRTGWGTFVPQAGIPGVVPGYLPPNVDIAVPWWRGYFWLFIVGISWFGIPSLLFGGYFFTKHKYTLKDVFLIVILFVATRFVAGFIAEFLIPYLAPEYYDEIYLTGISDRSYGSMRGNMSTAMAIIPVLLYIRCAKKDKEFFKNALSAMVIFAFSLSIADVWRPLSSLTELIGGSVAWGLWEYFTGFIFGGLIFWFYGRFSDNELAETDIPTGLEVSDWKPFGKFVLYCAALYVLFFHGIAESLEGGIRKAFLAAGVDYSPDVPTVKLIVTAIGVFFYWLYSQRKIGRTFAQKSFREKSLIVLIVMLPLYYLNFALHHIISGSLFLPDWNSSEVWLDSISFVIVEIYGIYLFRRYRKSLVV